MKFGWGHSQCHSIGIDPPGRSAARRPSSESAMDLSMRRVRARLETSSPVAPKGLPLCSPARSAGRGTSLLSARTVFVRRFRAGVGSVKRTASQSVAARGSLCSGRRSVADGSERVLQPPAPPPAPRRSSPDSAGHVLTRARCAGSETSSVKGLLAVDPTGKLAGKTQGQKQLCRQVCREIGWLEPVYHPGGALEDLIEVVVGFDGVYDTLCMLSYANGFVGMTYAYYRSKRRVDVERAVVKLSRHIEQRHVSKHLILFGPDVSPWNTTEFMDDYRLIHADILDLFKREGLNVGTSIEEEYYRGFGRFRGKLDENDHIKRDYGEEAYFFLHSVLKAASSMPTRTSILTQDLVRHDSPGLPSLCLEIRMG